MLLIYPKLQKSFEGSILRYALKFFRKSVIKKEIALDLGFIPFQW